MPDFLQNLRMRNLFGVDNPIGNDLPSQGGFGGNIDPRNPMGMSGGVDPYSNLFTQPNAPPNQFQTTPEVGPNLDIASKMKELYTPETENSNRLNALLSSYPQHEKASMLRKIGTAIIGGLGGSQAGNNFLNAPFNEKLEDWKNKVGPTERAANLERQGNVNERTMAYQTIAAELRQQAQDAKDRNDAVNAKIRQQRADVYQMKATNPDLKFDTTGSTIKVMDPNSGVIKDTGISTGNLTDADKLALQHENRIGEIGKTGEQQRVTAETRGWKVGTIPDPNNPNRQIGVQYNEVTGEVKPIQMGGQNIPGGISKQGNASTNPELQSIQNKTQETLSALDEILDEKGKLKPEMKSAIGASRMMGMQYLPATQTRAADAAIKRLKSMLIVDLIGEMKAQSKTGATGFGQLNMKELAVLESAASKLDPALDETTFEAELNRIREKLKKVLQPQDGLNPTITSKKPTAKDLILKYGGK